jgi:hypothetical protein
MVIQLFAAVSNEPAVGGSALGRRLNIFAHFATQSHVTIVMTCLRLAPSKPLTGTLADRKRRVPNQRQRTAMPIMC